MDDRAPGASSAALPHRPRHRHQRCRRRWRHRQVHRAHLERAIEADPHDESRDVAAARLHLRVGRRARAADLLHSRWRPSRPSSALITRRDRAPPVHRPAPSANATTSGSAAPGCQGASSSGAPDEHRQNRTSALGCGGQRRIVRQAQILTKPDDGRRRGGGHPAVLECSPKTIQFTPRRVGAWSGPGAPGHDGGLLEDDQQVAGVDALLGLHVDLLDHAGQGRGRGSSPSSSPRGR